MKTGSKLRKLRSLMKQYELSAAEVGEILSVGESTVHAWLSRGQTAPIPDQKLRLLELELSRRKR